MENQKCSTAEGFVAVITDLFEKGNVRSVTIASELDKEVYTIKRCTHSDMFYLETERLTIPFTRMRTEAILNSSVVFVRRRTDVASLAVLNMEIQGVEL